MSRYYLQIQNTPVASTIAARERRQRIEKTPPECYFQRAKVFAPEDKMVSAIFGIYLHRRGELDRALAEYKSAESSLSKYSDLAYNMGLLYFDLNEIEKAQEYAERARSLGYPLDGLSKKIERKKTATKESE